MLHRMLQFVSHLESIEEEDFESIFGSCSSDSSSSSSESDDDSFADPDCSDVDTDPDSLPEFSDSADSEDELEQDKEIMIAEAPRVFEQSVPIQTIQGYPFS